MNQPPKSSPAAAPGHYGAGYGEEVSPDVPPRPTLSTDADSPGTAGAESPLPATEPADTAPSDGGAAVDFTPADVGVRPPDQPPTENAPESEKVALIFERS